jgi:fibronectin type 3 domain-containing protein
VNGNYAFTPVTTDAPGATLAFSIQGKPAWATFSTVNGSLTGVPTTAGVFPDIIISASDGASSAALPGFSITVAAVVAASGGTVATLAWSEPTQNEDGTPLTDLVGYHIYVGPDASHLTSQVNIATAATTNYALSGLVSGTTYYFAVTAVNSAGQESALSNVASQVI